MHNRIDSLMAEKIEDLAKSTIELYGWCLHLFADWIDEEGLDPAHLEKVDILRWLNSRGWSQSMKHNAVCAMKHYYRRYHSLEPLEDIHIKRPRPKPQRTLYVDEYEKLLASIDTSKDEGIRDLSIITLMVDTGMRANELCTIRIEDVDHERRFVDMRIKGGDWHRAVFGEYAAFCLGNWLQIRPIHAGTGVPFLYVGIGGSTAGQKFTVTGLRANFYKLARKADIPKFSPHALRRTFATISTRMGVPKRIVQANGGWRTPDMVDRYTMHIRPEDMPGFPTDHVMGLDEDKETASQEAA